MLARTKQAPAPTLADRVRHAADLIRAADAEAKAVINLYIDEQKSSQAGRDLPRQTLEQMVYSRYKDPWYVVLALESGELAR
jgi:hypothetical protein